MAAPRPEIRPFRLWDLGRILEIERASFPREAYEAALFRELYRDCGQFFLVARLGCRIAGYVVTSVAGGEAELVSIAVDPAYRNRGVAGALMRRTLAALRRRKVAALRLMVRPGNAAAVAFYRRWGFQRTGYARHYYDDGGAAVRMTLRFP